MPVQTDDVDGTIYTAHLPLGSRATPEDPNQATHAFFVRADGTGFEKVVRVDL